MNTSKKYQYLDKEFYLNIKELLNQSRKAIYRNIQNQMVFTYWQIGKMIVEKQNGEPRAEFGAGLIKELSLQMTNDFGSGYNERSLRNMRQFYLLFPIWSAVRAELSWTHYKCLLHVEDDKARTFYMNGAIEANWSTRQLEREINTFSYQRYLGHRTGILGCSTAEMKVSHGC